jgi:hypothetical protein
VNVDDLRAADGVVTIDPRERTLTVRPAPDADAHAKVLWRAGVRAQAAASGRAAAYGRPDPTTAPTVWASGGGRTQIAFGLPTGDGALTFHFYRGHPTYRKLVTTPGLRARFVVDRESSQILSVRFRGRDR